MPRPPTRAAAHRRARLPGRRDLPVARRCRGTLEERPDADRRHRGTRGAAPHRAALGADPLPARPCPRRGGGAGGHRPAGGLGEDGRPGLARAAPARGATAGRASRWPSWPSCSRSWVTRCSRARCCRRCWPRPPWPASPARRTCRRRGCPVWPTAPHRPPWRSAPAPQPWRRARHGALALAGAVRPVLGLPTARLVLVPADDGAGGRRWLRARPRGAGRRCPVEALPALDAHPGRGAARPSGATAGRGAAGASRSWSPTTTCAAWP